MAAADILTRLLLNTTDFDQKLGKSKKDVDSWSKQMTGMGSVVGGAMKGIAGAAGLAFGAMETFDRIIKANETNNDKWENTMRAVNNSVNEFFSALTSGDFSLFSQGLDNIRKKAIDTAEALRQIEDAQTVYGYFNSKYQADFTEQLNVLRNKNSSVSAKEGAMSNAQSIIEQERSMANSFSQKAIDAAFNLFTQRSMLSADSFSLEDVEKVLIANTREGYENELDLWAAQKREYDALLEELNKTFTKTQSYLTNYGSATTSFIDVDDPEYQKTLKELEESYRIPLLNAAITNTTNGNDLKAAVGFLAQAEQARRVASRMETTLLRYGNVTSGSGEDASTPAEGSIAYLQAELTKAQDAVINATDETARIAAQKTVNELKEQIQGLTVWAETQAALQQGNLGTYVFGDNYGIDEEAINKVPEFKDEIDLKDSKIEVPELPDQSDNIQETTDALGVLAGAISNITGLVDSGAAAWASYFGNIIQTVGQAIPLIDALTNSQNQAAAAEGKKAAMGAGSSVSNIPVVGPILAVAAIASVVAALASIPKFAEGGIVGGSSYYGDKILARLNSGEMVLNQRQQARLLDSIERPQQNIHITGKLTAEGRDLSIVLSDYNIYRRQ